MSQATMVWILVFVFVLAWALYPAATWRLVRGTAAFVGGVVVDLFALLLAWI